MTPSEHVEIFALWVLAVHKRRGIQASDRTVNASAITARASEILDRQFLSLAEATDALHEATINYMKELQ